MADPDTVERSVSPSSLRSLKRTTPLGHEGSPFPGDRRPLLHGSDTPVRAERAGDAGIAPNPILFQKAPPRVEGRRESDLANLSVLRRCAAWLLAGLLLLAAAPAAAAVTITFYSHELGSSFPHAFVT